MARRVERRVLPPRSVARKSNPKWGWGRTILPHTLEAGPHKRILSGRAPSSPYPRFPKIFLNFCSATFCSTLSPCPTMMTTGIAPAAARSRAKPWVHVLRLNARSTSNHASPVSPPCKLHDAPGTQTLARSTSSSKFTQKSSLRSTQCATTLPREKPLSIRVRKSSS